MSRVDHEGWLTSRLRELYPSHDEWVVDGVCSASIASEDKGSTLDIICSFLGAHGELSDLVDELFRRKGGKDIDDKEEGLRNSEGSKANKEEEEVAGSVPKFLSIQDGTSGAERGKRCKSKAQGSQVTTLTSSSGKPLQPKDLNRRVVNCLACGKIFDCRPKNGVMNESAKAFLENSGQCTFCGTQVALDATHEDAAGRNESETKKEKSVDLSRVKDASRVASSASTGSRTGMLVKMTSHYNEDCGVSTQVAAARAKDAKDRLVEFDRTAASRTVVIDDQSDWFEIDGNAWLDESERVELKKQAAVGAGREIKEEHSSVNHMYSSSTPPKIISGNDSLPDFFSFALVVVSRKTWWRHTHRKREKRRKRDEEEVGRPFH